MKIIEVGDFTYVSYDEENSCRRPRDQASCVVDAVDLFCGGGGLTCGLRKAGINVKMGVEIDPLCRYAYEHNNEGARFLEKSVIELKASEIRECFAPGHISLLAGCPPCQTFSSYNQKASPSDPRFRLPSEFGRLVREVMPDVVSLENVPLLIKRSIFANLVNEMKSLGYNVDWKIVFCPDYGWPQRRKRLVLLASKLGPIEVPAPTHIRPPTVREMIGHLPKLRNGECDPNDRLHFCAALSPLNLERIKHSSQGGTWREWPTALVASCHRKNSGKTYPGVYGRMSWDKPAPTMTTQFYGFGNGRFGHPEQDRAISIREGAIFQGFPMDYQFLPEGSPRKISLLGRMIGNAVPVQLGEMVGRTIMEHVREYRGVSVRV